MTRYVPFALALLATSMAVSCGKPESSGNVLKVGAILSTTGGAAAYGGDAEKGARLAVKQISKDGGTLKLQYTSLDDKSDKTEALKQARTLMDASGAHVILGPAISPSAITVGKLAEERQIPMVGTSPTQDEVTWSAEYDRSFVFRVCFNDSFQGKVLARFVHEDLGLKTAAIVYDKTLSYSIGLSKTFKEEFTRRGGAVLREENYSVKDTDYSALIDKVAAFNVDVLFIPGWDENVGPMLKQAGDRWDSFVIVGGDGLPSNRLLELSGGNIRQVYALSHYDANDPDKMVQEFRNAYKAEYGEEATAFSALGYDTMMLIWDAASRAKSLGGPDLRDALAATNELRLVTGTLSFDEHRNPNKEAVVVKIGPDGIRFFKRVRL